MKTTSLSNKKHHGSKKSINCVMINTSLGLAFSVEASRDVGLTSSSETST
jgi:hypothetical protein